MIKHFTIGLILPILAIFVFTFWSVQLDHIATSFFYVDGHFESNVFTNFMYFYGFYPAWGVIFIAFGILFASLFWSRFKEYRKAAIYLILVLGIGSGLIIHAALKDHWGRPRPKQVIDYGGNQPFRAYYEPNFMHQTEPSKSFPCGHCSVGFYFFAVALLGLYYQRKFWFWMGLIVAFGLGFALGYARIAQGGHFLSDVLVSGVIMWIVSLVLFRWMFCRHEGCRN